MVGFKFNFRELYFLVRFLTIFLLFYFLIIFLLPTRTVQSYIAFVVSNALGLNASQYYIFVDSHVFEIAPDCTGLVSLALMLAVLLSLKKPSTKKKFVLFLMAVLFILPLNILRLILVLSAAKISFQLGSFLHVLTWFLMAIFVFSFWTFIISKIYKIKIDETFI